MRGGPCTLADKQVRPTPNNNSSTADSVTECLVLATRSNLMIGSRLNGARCGSACVYAMVGASTRHVDPGATLRIHSGVGRELDKAENFLRRYVTVMGVDPDLVDAAAKRAGRFSHQERTWRSIEPTRAVSKKKRGAICPGLGTSPQRAASNVGWFGCPTASAHRVRDSGTAAKLAAGVGFRATSSRNGGRPHPRMVGESTKTEPRLLR